MTHTPEWWRSAVIYQVYPRSFADGNGDGIGDLIGIRQKLPHLKSLGVDAVWLSPFFTSPQRDAGYDVANYVDVDPIFGTLQDFDDMLASAHELGLRIIVDLVPNHSSSDHPWFQEALAAGEGSPERARYLFRDGKGAHGELPPNNWESIFGGPAWTRTTNPDGTPGQWYLHLFDSTQPDFDWTNPWVHEQFRAVLRFWLDRGVDGFRIDVAHGLFKAEGLPDWNPPAAGDSMTGGGAVDSTPPFFAQPGVHDVYRDWNRIFAEYDGDRVLCAEAWVEPLPKLADWVRPDELHQAFNFPYLSTGWDAVAVRRVIDDSIAAFAAVGAPSTWVLSNHDVVRHASRLALTAENPQGEGIGPASPGLPDPVVGLRRARAASTMMFALPGSAYVYQGEELGLPEAIHLPDEARQDPTWFRTNGERYGRDGCRVPLPWVADAPAFGFNDTGASWLPQPSEWAALAVNVQDAVAGSTLELYREALRLRREYSLGLGSLTWNDTTGLDALSFTVSAGGAVARGAADGAAGAGDGAAGAGDVTVVSNFGQNPIALPAGRVLLSSAPITGGMIPAETTVWVAPAAL